MEQDIVDRLLDFDRCGLTAADRVNMRECAAIEIHRLRQQVDQLEKSDRDRNWKIFDSAMQILEDVPGDTLLERIAKLKGLNAAALGQGALK